MIATARDLGGRRTDDRGTTSMAKAERFTREELLKGVSMGGYEDNAEAAEPAAPSPLVNRSCTRCGRVYGMTRRCYSCNPGRRRKGETARDHDRAAIRSVVTASPSPGSLSREIDAARAVAVALDGLDAASATRVLAWVAAHFAEGGGA